MAATLTTHPSAHDGRGRFRRLLLAAPAVLAVAPHLIPLPRTPNRAAVDVAADLGRGGRLVEALGTRAWAEEAVLRVPAAIIWGRGDRWIPLSAGEALRASLPDAEWHIIDGAGHVPMHERPDALTDILLSWLERTR